MNLELTEREYENFRDLIYQKSGINLHEDKKELLKARLAKVLRRQKIASINEYYRLLMNDKSGHELVTLLDHISTNLTYFFREPKHFNFLEKTAFPKLFHEKGKSSKSRVKIWCAGCSSGEEPYSVVFSLLDYILKTMPLISTSGPQKQYGINAIGEKTSDSNLNLSLISNFWDINILATDISTRMLSISESGIYNKDKIKKFPMNYNEDISKRVKKNGLDIIE